MNRSDFVCLSLAVALAAGACTPPPAGRSHASANALAACRQRADANYTAQNRGEVYAADTYSASTRDAPFAGAGLPGITTNGLAGRYQRDTMISDCLNIGESPAQPDRTSPTPTPLPQ